MSAQAALNLREETDSDRFSCIQCGQPVQPYTEGQVAAFRHGAKATDCFLGEWAEAAFLVLTQ